MEPLSTPNSQGPTPQADHAMKVAAIALLALTVGACALRAPYKAPTVAPTTMKNADPALVVEESFDPRWWGQFEPRPPITTFASLSRVSIRRARSSMM